ncbi:hypothetical protein RND71_011780 [Anisodus tanguticus]|uniref:Uncharacterized protein n=1 Tax=Anisodus tanguticus TaxID=243964 RepID=A0AAE1VFD4_9SOLA|nr:hypothetical protein RND71_011780 [Anisodus tanguticus]
MDSCTVRTTDHQDTTMADIGPCGSCPCSGALMLPRSWLRFRRQRRLTHRPGFDNVRQVQCISFSAYKPEGY